MSGFNLPPGVTLNDIDPPQYCVRCNKRCDDLDDQGYCQDCAEDDRRDTPFDDDDE